MSKNNKSSRSLKEENEILKKEVKLLKTQLAGLKETIFLSSKSEEKFSEIFNAAPIGMAIASFEGCFTRVNEAICKATGYSRDELLKLKFIDITHPDDRSENLDWVIQLAKGEISQYQMEKRYIRKDGSLMHAILTVTTERDKNNKPIRLIGQIVDISNIKKFDQLREMTFEIAKEANKKIDIQLLSQFIQIKLSSFLEVKNFYIALYDKSSGFINFPYFIDENYIESGFIPKSRKPKKGLTEYIIRTGKPLLASDNDIRDMIKKRKIKIIGPIPKIWLGVPLKSEQNVFGVIAVQSYSNRHIYTKETVELLEFISSQISGTIERQQNHDALRDSKNKYSTLFHQSNEGTFIHDINGKILQVNQKAIKLTGYSETELLKMKMSQLHPVKEKKKSIHAINSIISKGYENFEIEFMKKNKQVFPGEVSATAFTLKGEKVVQCLLRDITKRKEAEYYIRKKEAFQESERKFRQYLENINLFAISLNNQGKIIFINDFAFKLTGWKQHQVMGKDWFKIFIPKKRQKESKKKFLRVINKEEKLTKTYETEILTKNNEILNIKWNASMVYNKDQIAGVAGIGEDVTDWKLTEKALRLSDNVLKKVGNLILVGNSKGEIVYVSPSVKKLLGYQQSELIGNGWWEKTKDYAKDKIKEKNQLKLWAQMKKPIRKQPVINLIKKRNGDYCWIQWHNSKGPDDLVIGVGHDITSQKLANEALLQSEERYRDLVENNKDLICTHDLKGKILTINLSFSKTLGYRKKELIGKNIRSLIIPNFKHEFSLYLNNIKENEQASGIMQVHTKKGVRKVLKYNNTLRTKDVKKPIVRGMAFDITDIFEAERKLRRSEEKFRSIFESIQDVYYRTDTNGLLEIVSPSVFEMLGYKQNEIIGKDILSIYVNPEERKELISVLEKEGSITNFETELRKKDGSTIYVSANSKNVKNELGEITGIEGIVREITSKKKAEKELIRAKKIAEESAKEKAEFCANMSHEIRTPMNGIIGMIDLLADTPLSYDQRDFASTIKESAETLLTIVNDVLSFSTIDSDKVKLKPVPVNIPLVFKQLQQLFETEAKKKFISLSFKISKNVPDLVLVDDVRLQQVLNNLIDNAIKFTEKGDVTVSVKCRDTKPNSLKLVFEIVDTGIGISKQDQKKLFDSFSQLDSSTTKKYKGTGLGLAICRGIVKKMGGQIGVSSSPGIGSRFWFYLSTKPANANLITKEKSLKPRNDTRLIGRVLLVEDDPVNQMVTGKMLEKMGITVHLANDGNDGLKKVKKNTYDLIIMDVHMPDKSGRTFLFELKALLNEKCPPIIALSANTLEEIKVDFFKLGVAHYLTKPIGFDTLYSSINKYFKKVKKTKKRRKRLSKRIKMDLASNEMINQTTFSYLKKLFGNNISEILNEYNENIHILLKNIEYDLEENKVSDAMEKLHRIKGTSAAIGITKIANFADNIHLELKNNNPDNVDVKFKELKKLSNKFDKQIQQIIKDEQLI